MLAFPMRATLAACSVRCNPDVTTSLNCTSSFSSLLVSGRSLSYTVPPARNIRRILLSVAFTALRTSLAPTSGWVSLIFLMVAMSKAIIVTCDKANVSPLCTTRGSSASPTTSPALLSAHTRSPPELRTSSWPETSIRRQRAWVPWWNTWWPRWKRTSIAASNSVAVWLGVRSWKRVWSCKLDWTVFASWARSLDAGSSSARSGRMGTPIGQKTRAHAASATMRIICMPHVWLKLLRAITCSNLHSITMLTAAAAVSVAACFTTSPPPAA
mmetsp:Transcript_25676/g.48580  ORF Transcript_25676/g.48580 Transcript_25676/m.48580 type:complete len:270 (-) Transcript_25676:11-820(-)